MQQATETRNGVKIAPSASEQPRVAVSRGERLVSLDAFRGLTVAGMILVNNPGSWEYVYPPLRHARWHGWTPTDLVFPFFLFIIGVSLSYSFGSRLDAGETGRALHAKILRRSALLFLIGVLLNAWEKVDGFGLSVPLANFRIFGVLQRIAVVYLVASLVTLHTRLKGQAIALGACLLGYWALMKLVPVPGYGAGDLSYADHNLAAYLDRIVLRGHLAGKTWDGLGVLSMLPAVGSALAGVLTAHLLRSGKDKRIIAGWLFVLGWGAILLGLVWDLWFPINKLLWTSSYVVFTTGGALELLGVCYWLIDVQGWRRWAMPAIVLGCNALTAFVLSTIVYLAICPVPFNSKNPSIRGWVYQHLFASWANPYNASLGFAVTYVLLWLAVTAVLYRRRIFIKI